MQMHHNQQQATGRKATQAAFAVALQAAYGTRKAAAYLKGAGWNFEEARDYLCTRSNISSRPAN